MDELTRFFENLGVVQIVDMIVVAAIFFVLYSFVVRLGNPNLSIICTLLCVAAFILAFFGLKYSLIVLFVILGSLFIIFCVLFSKEIRRKLYALKRKKRGIKININKILHQNPRGVMNDSERIVSNTTP